MKKILFPILLIFFAASSGFAQEMNKEENSIAGPVKNIIKNSPFHFVEGTFLLSYERMLNQNKSSIMISAGPRSLQRQWTNTQEIGMTAELQYRFYVAPPRDRAMGNGNGFWFKGIYAGPFVTYRFIDQETEEWDWVSQSNRPVHNTINEYAGGVLMGVQFAIVNRVFLDLFTGGGMKISTGLDNAQVGNGGIASPGYNGVIPKGGFQIGIGF